MYFDQNEVKSINFLLQQDINKQKTEKSKTALEDFGKIVDYAKNIGCRHAMFSKYFNDKKLPECKKMCDFCKDPKAAQKALGMFLQLSCNYYSAPVDDNADPLELYGGRLILSSLILHFDETHFHLQVVVKVSATRRTSMGTPMMVVAVPVSRQQAQQQPMALERSWPVVDDNSTRPKHWNLRRLRGYAV